MCLWVYCPWLFPLYLLLVSLFLPPSFQASKSEPCGCKEINSVPSSYTYLFAYKTKSKSRKSHRRKICQSMQAPDQKNRDFLSCTHYNDGWLASAAVSHSLILSSAWRIPWLEIRLSICLQDIDRQWLFIWLLLKYGCCIEGRHNGIDRSKWLQRNYSNGPGKAWFYSCPYYQSLSLSLKSVYYTSILRHSEQTYSL